MTSTETLFWVGWNRLRQRCVVIGWTCHMTNELMAVIGGECQVTGGGGGGVDEEVKRVQAECRYLSAEIQRLRDDNSKLRVSTVVIALH